MPWLVAIFIGLVYLVPIDDVTLPVKLPVNATLDRFVLPGIVFVWLIVLVAGRRDRPRVRVGVVDLAMWLFSAAVLLSILVNFDDIAERGEWSLAIKRTSILVAYLLLFYVVATVIRPSELRAFGRLLIGLGAVLAAALIWEYSTGANVLNDIANALLAQKSGPSDGNVDSMGRFAITGPSSHGLVAATLLAVSLAFTGSELARAGKPSRRLLYMIAFGLLLAGGFATFRKSSAILPAVSIGVFVLCYPRALRALLPVTAVSVAVVALLVPGAVESVGNQLNPETLESATTTQARVADYETVGPDVIANGALGRGYGTFDALRYRLLDNQFLKILVETGAFGLIAYFFVLLAAVGLAISARARGVLDGGVTAAALAAALTGAAVANAFYDSLGFAQYGYMLFFLAGLAVVAGTAQSPGRPATVVSLVGHEAGTSTVRRLPRARTRVRAAGRTAALVTIVVIAGVVVGSLRGGDSPERTLILNDTIAIENPASWQRLERPPRISGLRMRDAIAVAPKTEEEDVVLVAGLVEAEHETLLPDAFRRRLARRASPDDPVQLGSLQAYRYASLRPRGTAGDLLLYVSPTSAGVVAVWCLAGSEAPETMPSCQRVADTVQLVRDKPYPLGPSRDLAAALQNAFDRLNAQRRAGRRELRDASTRRAQGLAADRLAAHYAAAANTIAGATVSPASASLQRRVVDGLRAVRRAHVALATAARRGDGSAYEAARRSATRRERAVDKILESLRGPDRARPGR